MELLFAGGLSSNIPAAAKTEKNPPKAIANVKTINDGTKRELLLKENCDRKDKEGLDLKTRISLIKNIMINRNGSVTNISLPKE